MGGGKAEDLRGVKGGEKSIQEKESEAAATERDRVPLGKVAVKII